MSNAPCPIDTQLIADLRAVVPQASAAWLYGSAARNALRPDSDIDVALLLPQAMTFEQKWDWTEHLSTLWKRDVDVVDFRSVSCVLQNEVLQGGRRLFADDPFKTSLIELHAASQYREHNERYAQDFERIARTGKVFA
jgi:uncharacterized protein